MSQFLPRTTSDRSTRPAHPSNKLRNLLDRPHATTDVELTIRPLRRPPSFILTFTDLTYKVKTTKKPTNTKTLLNSVSGKAREGEIMAVLGASGSGKTTLIDALADRIAHGSLQGSITLNGDPIDRKVFKSVSAYVMQDDLLFPMLTVEETLMFTAEFRLRLPTHKKKERVQILIDQLDLRAASKTYIGDEGHRGVSGGERRRVSIGMDIIHDPVVLFLDEPTSGLDSTSAFMVVNILRRIAESGSIVVMSVHQPSYRILELIDNVMFLSGGRTVFIGSPADIRPFFTEFGHAIPKNENLTEFALDVVREVEESCGGVSELVEFNRLWQFRRKGVNIRYDDDDNISFMKALMESRGELKTAVGGFANPFWKEMVVLSKRSFLNSWRMPELFATRLVVVLVTGFIFATVFWRLELSLNGLQERTGFFASAIITIFLICAEALPIFLQERLIFLQETTSYRRSSYVLSNVIVAIPPLVILGIAFAATTFFAIGLAGGLHGFLFYFLAILVSFFTGNSFATFLSGVLTQEQLGFTVVTSTLFIYVLFSGFFITRNSIPIYWLWFHYISLVKYPYEAISLSEFGNPNACFVRGSQMFDDSPLGNVNDNMKKNLLNVISATLRFNVTMEGCIMTGPDILEKQGITQLNKWNCLWISLAWGFLFRVLFYVSLCFGSKNKRR